MDDALLQWALQRVRGDALAAMTAGGPAGRGIGTLGERTLHAALKYCFEPDERFHEAPLDGFVADIARRDGIIEIQTGGFYPLQKKLAAFLEHGPVTVVHPLAVQKRLLWLDPATGTLSAAHKSPRPAQPADVLAELYWLRAYLRQPGFRLCLVQLAVDEYRLQNGRGPAGKRGGVRFERLPTAFLGQQTLTQPAEYACLLPKKLPAVFTAAEFSAATRLRGRRSYYALQTLRELGLVGRCEEKRGRALLYRRLDPPADDF